MESQSLGQNLNQDSLDFRSQAYSVQTMPQNPTDLTVYSSIFLASKYVKGKEPQLPTRENLLEYNGPRFHACPVQIRLDRYLFNEWMNNQMGGLGPPPSSPHCCLSTNLPSRVSVSGEFSEMEGSRLRPWKVIDFGRGVGGGEGEFQEGGMAWPWAGRREGKCDWTRLTPEDSLHQGVRRLWVSGGWRHSKVAGSYLCSLISFKFLFLYAF